MRIDKLLASLQIVGLATATYPFERRYVNDTGAANSTVVLITTSTITASNTAVSLTSSTTSSSAGTSTSSTTPTSSTVTSNSADAVGAIIAINSTQVVTSTATLDSTSAPTPPANSTAPALTSSSNATSFTAGPVFAKPANGTTTDFTTVESTQTEFSNSSVTVTAVSIVNGTLTTFATEEITATPLMNSSAHSATAGPIYASSASVANVSSSAVSALASTVITSSSSASAVQVLSPTTQTVTRVATTTDFVTVDVTDTIYATSTEYEVTITDTITKYVTATFSALPPIGDPSTLVTDSACTARTVVITLPASLSPSIVATPGVNSSTTATSGPTSSSTTSDAAVSYVTTTYITTVTTTYTSNGSPVVTTAVTTLSVVASVTSQTGTASVSYTADNVTTVSQSVAAATSEGGAVATSVDFCPNLDATIWTDAQGIQHVIYCDMAFNGTMISSNGTLIQNNGTLPAGNATMPANATVIANSTVAANATNATLRRRDVSPSSLAQCITQCDKLSNCVGTAYNGTDCFYYSSLTSSYASTGVEFARLVVSSASSSSQSISTTLKSTSTTTRYTTITAVSSNDGKATTLTSVTLEDRVASTSSSVLASSSVICNVTATSIIRNKRPHPTLFCNNWNAAKPHTFSPFGKLTVKQVSNACSCILAQTTSSTSSSVISSQSSSSSSITSATSSTSIVTSSTKSSSSLKTSASTSSTSFSKMSVSTSSTSSSKTSATSSTTSSTKSSSSLKTSSSVKTSASSTCSTVTAPAPTQTGIVSGCTEWYTAVSGDYCYLVASKYNLDVATFMTWNPAVNAPSCNNMQIGNAYCVAVNGCASSGTSTTLTSSAGTSTATTRTSSGTATSATATSSAVAYKMYTGNGTVAAGWPSQSHWVDFDTMFELNKPIMLQSCENNWDVANDSTDEIADLKAAILDIGTAQDVDPRFILAIVMQESNGCVRVVTTSWSVANPGLMQSHDGSGTCNDDGTVQNPCPQAEIYQMIEDGTAGTSSGDGLVQCLAETDVTDVSKYYRAARIYNGGVSGYNADNLGSGCCTLCYSSDVANRLTGWSTGTSGCTL